MSYCRWYLITDQPNAYDAKRTTARARRPKENISTQLSLLAGTNSLKLPPSPSTYRQTANANRLVNEEAGITLDAGTWESLREAGALVGADGSIFDEALRTAR